MRFITYMFVYHFGLSVKKDPLAIQHPKLESRNAIHSCEIMADATFFTPPSPEFSAALLSNKC